MARKVMQRNYDSEGNLVSKECSKCHEIKSASEFSKDKNSKDGLYTICKQCKKQYYKNNYEHYKEYRKEYKENNSEKIKQYNKEYYNNNIEKIKQYNKEHYKNNCEYYKEYKKEYVKNNSEKIKQYKKEYNKKNHEKLKQNRKNNIDKKREYDKEYRQKNIKKIKEYKQEYYKNNIKHFKEYRENNIEKIKDNRKKYYNKQIQEALQQIKIELESNPRKYNYIEGKEIYGVIYLVHNIKTNRYYVGQTTVGFDNRYPSGWLYYHRNKELIKEDLQLYGENSFEYTKLFKVAHSQYELDKLEAYYIDYYNSYENGYNETRGNIFTDRGKEK